jgi:hypothetical protein
VSQIPENLATALIAFTSGATVVVLNHVFTSRRSYDEKIWELRRTAYGTILVELAEVENVLGYVDEYIQRNSEEWYFNNDISGKHTSIIAEHMRIIRKLYTDNYLILSDRFIYLFERFLRALDESNNPNLSPPEEREIFAAAVRAARPKLLQQARSEIPLRGEWKLPLAWKLGARKLFKLPKVFGGRKTS